MAVSQQAELSAFHTARELRDTHPQTPLPITSMRPRRVNERRCQHCQAHVSVGFRRTHGDSRNVAHACPECASKRELKDDHAAATPGWSP